MKRGFWIAIEWSQRAPFLSKQPFTLLLRVSSVSRFFFKIHELFHNPFSNPVHIPIIYRTGNNNQSQQSLSSVLSPSQKKSMCVGSLKPPDHAIPEKVLEPENVLIPAQNRSQRQQHLLIERNYGTAGRRAYPRRKVKFQHNITFVRFVYMLNYRMVKVGIGNRADVSYLSSRS